MRKLAILLPLLLAAARAEAGPIPRGEGEQTISLRGTDFDVLTYRPNCPNPSLLMSFHGSGRKAEAARRTVRRLADRHCLLVLAPRFDEERFPFWRYNAGGIMQKGKLQDREQWSGHFAIALVEWARKQEQKPLPYYVIGHSAGGQYVNKFAAFIPNEAKRIVVANPLVYLAASVEAPPPQGFGGGVFPAGEVDERLRHYLNQPMTFLLGEKDRGYTQGHRVFSEARELTLARGWSFNWRLIEVPGIGHDADAMLASPEAERAIKP